MVIAIIVVLMAILMPSLRIAKEQARSINCRSNVRTLTFAWLMYKDENDAKLVGGHPAGSVDFKPISAQELEKVKKIAVSLNPIFQSKA